MQEGIDYTCKKFFFWHNHKSRKQTIFLQKNSHLLVYLYLVYNDNSIITMLFEIIRKVKGTKDWKERDKIIMDVQTDKVHHRADI